MRVAEKLDWKGLNVQDTETWLEKKLQIEMLFAIWTTTNEKCYHLQFSF
jgi:hypothetical protein